MLDFVVRTQDDGHDVKWFFRQDDRTKNYGKGIAEHIVKDWREWMRWADLVVLADNTIYLRELDAWRDRGVPIIGATKEAAAWELDRQLGQSIFKKHGIKIPDCKEFKHYDEALAYVKKEGRPFVCKPSYDEADKSLSYVSKSPADMVWMLEKWKKAKRHKGPFVLQEKVSGCEMAVGGWFGPGGFNEGWCENWEFKSFMAGDRGPNVGEMGTVLRFVRSSKLADKVLKPLEAALDKLGYCGYVDVNCIIDDKGVPYPLEFTMRMGWPTFNIQQALIKGDHAEWLASLAAGRDNKSFLLNQVATGVVMALPEFPYGKSPMETVTGVPIYGLTQSLLSNVHLCEAMRMTVPVDAGSQVVNLEQYVTAGDYVLVASGVGSSVQTSRAKAYRILEKLRLPASPFWRPDIGSRLKKQLPLVQMHGYAKGMEF